MTTWTDAYSGRPQYDLELVVTAGTQSTSGNWTDVDFLLRIRETTSHGSYAYSGLTWSVTIGGQNWNGSTSFDSSAGGLQTKTFKSGTKRITHNSDGTKSITVYASSGGGTVFGSASITSKTFTLPTIPRKSYPEFEPDNNIVVGESVTIDFNRNSSSFEHNVKWFFGGDEEYVGQGIETASVSWTPAMSMLNLMPNAASQSGYMRVATYSGGSSIGYVDEPFTLTAPASVKPTIGTVAVSEGTTSPDVDSIVGTFVQGVSTLVGEMSGDAGVYGSTITDRRFTTPSGSVVALPDTSPVESPTPIQVSGAQNVVFSVTDSRGRVTTQNESITILPYSQPVAHSMTVARCDSGGTVDPNGTYAKVSLTIEAASLNNGGEKNGLTAKLYIREKGESSWGAAVATVVDDSTTMTFSGSEVIGGSLGLASSYEVRLELYDRLTESTPIYVQRTIAVAAATFHITSNGKVGIGKYHENGELDVGGEAYNRHGSLVEPIGVMVEYLGATAPAGWLLCQGQAVSRSTYANLFALIGTQHGAGDGSTTFNLPDMRKRVPVGYDSSDSDFDALGKTGGEKEHTLTTDEVPNLWVRSESGLSVRLTSSQYDVSDLGSGNHRVSFNNSDETGGTSASHLRTWGGGGGSHNNMQPFVVVNYIVKAI